MDLTTTCMGLTLKNPLVVGASPLSDDVGTVRALEDAGAAAVVMHSLFMEQLAWEQDSMLRDVLAHEHGFAEALTYSPEPVGYALGPEEYLEQVARLKSAVDIPVIGSLNGTQTGDWTHHAALIQQAGADGLELNVYYLPLDGAEPPDAVEERFLSVLTAVRAEVTIPVSMKLTSFFSSPIHLARRLEAAGASGFVLFNRLFPADIDIDALEVHPALHLSDPFILGVRLLWLAAMFGQVRASLAASGGVHETADVIKSVMAGASTVQMASVLLRRGPSHLARLGAELAAWMDEHDYTALSELHGSMSRQRCPDPEAWERPNYVRTLQQWHPGQ
jgi:dihydroorotate dehydrogenase (fumarate)